MVEVKIRRAIMLVVLAACLFLIVIAVAQGNWRSALVYAVIAALFGGGWLLDRPRVTTSAKEVTHPPLSRDDVTRVTADAGSRVDAVKSLRRQYPVLGLAEATELVDEARRDVGQ